jgi:hypothetical protein
MREQCRQKRGGGAYDKGGLKKALTGRVSAKSMRGAKTDAGYANGDVCRSSVLNRPAQVSGNRTGCPFLEWQGSISQDPDAPAAVMLPMDRLFWQDVSTRCGVKTAHSPLEARLKTSAIQIKILKIPCFILNLCCKRYDV